ncbi:MAG TPA: hypothetical protein VMW17_22630 [Candidatus Binatia bacterium]|nr:hypothetical protein [Candidatus Binatia bacterium]
MATPGFDDSTFWLVSCPACDKLVLTHLADIDDDGNEVRRCVHCDGEVGDDWREVSGVELEQHGYAVLGARGCGNGGGCSSGCGMRSSIPITGSSGRQTL